MKKTHIFGIIAFSLLALPLVLWTNHLWPFTSQPSEPALFGTAFEMTLPDVQTTLKEKGIQLVDLNTFKKEHPEISNNLVWYANFKPTHREDSEITETWYLPPLEMFESHIFGKFNFTGGKLTSMDLQVNPYYLSDTRTLQHAQHIAEVMTQDLKKQYRFVKNEVSTEIPGAYRMILKGKYSQVDVWVNLSNQPDPVIYIYLTYLPPSYE